MQVGHAMLLPYDCSTSIGKEPFDHLSRVHSRHGIEEANVRVLENDTVEMEGSRWRPVEQWLQLARSSACRSVMSFAFPTFFEA
jgi:hypothetical protein